MLSGNQYSFQKKSLNSAIHRDSRSAGGRYRSDSAEDSAKELQMVGLGNLLFFLCQEKRNKYYYVVIAKVGYRLTYLAIIWNFRCAPIPAIFVSYPNTKFKRIEKEHTTIVFCHFRMELWIAHDKAILF